MASSKEYLNFILEQLSELDGIAYKPMMGEYIIYLQEKIVGGIYDNRFLVKPTKSAKELMPNAPFESPYDGAKPMLMVEDIDNKDILASLLNAMFDELPKPKSTSFSAARPSEMKRGAGSEDAENDLKNKR